MRDPGNFDHLSAFQFNRLRAQPVKQSDPLGEQHGDKVEHNPVQGSGLDALLSDIGAPEINISVTGGCFGFLQRAFKPLRDEGKRVLPLIAASRLSLVRTHTCRGSGVPSSPVQQFGPDPLGPSPPSQILFPITTAPAVLKNSSTLEHSDRSHHRPTPSSPGWAPDRHSARAKTI